MEPIARPTATLVDLLDRVLDRGLVLHADIIISLAGVPLIGLQLRAALAGIETMVRYGVLEEWDEDIRAHAPALMVSSSATAAAREAIRAGAVRRSSEEG